MRIIEQFPHAPRFEIFADMPRAAVRDFLDGCVARTLRPQTVLLSEGQHPDAVYLIAHGAVDVTLSSRDGRRVLLHRGYAGVLLGEMEMLAELPCIADCEAATPATALVFGRAHLLEALEIPLFRRNVFRVHSRRLDRANQLRVLDASGRIDQRLAAYLLYLAGSGSVVDENQSFMAELLGCSRQTVNRELGALRDQGVIETQNSRVRILDPDRLDALARTRIMR